MQTDLQLVKAVKLHKDTVQRVTQRSFHDIAFHCNAMSHYSPLFQGNFSFWPCISSLFEYHLAKTFWAMLEFINVYLYCVHFVKHTHWDYPTTLMITYPSSLHYLQQSGSYFSTMFQTHT